MTVNIYMYQTIRGPGKKAGSYTFILETIIKGKPATLTVTDTLEPMSENKAELTILLKALKRLRKECDVVVYGASNYIITGLNEWLESWEASGWKNKKGKDIANMDEWKEVRDFMKKIKITTSCEKHSYSRWIEEETLKKERQRKNV